MSMEEQFVHMVSDSRSHLLLVFRHWSQAKVEVRGVNDQDERSRRKHNARLTSGASPLSRGGVVVGYIRV